MRNHLIETNQNGLYCPEAWRPVDRAVITHAHSDHARLGSRSYLAHRDSAPILKLRLGQEINLETVEYGETRTIGGVKVSLHPAGHVLGSAQVRVEYRGEAWVVSGD